MSCESCCDSQVRNGGQWTGMPRGRRAPGPVRRPPGRERVNTIQGGSVQLDSAVNCPGVRPLSVGKGERIVGRDDLSGYLPKVSVPSPSHVYAKGVVVAPRMKKGSLIATMIKLPPVTSCEPPCALRRDRIEFGDKHRDEAAVIRRIQGDLAWLLGTVGDIAVSHGQLVAIGGGKHEIRGTGEFGGCGTRIIKYGEETLTRVLAQLSRRSRPPSEVPAYPGVREIPSGASPPPVILKGLTCACAWACASASVMMQAVNVIIDRLRSML